MKCLLLNLDKQREFLPFISVRSFPSPPPAPRLPPGTSTATAGGNRQTVPHGHRGIPRVRPGQLRHLPPPSGGITAAYRISPPAYSRAGAEQKGNPVVLEYGAQISTKRLEALIMSENRKPACVTTVRSGNTLVVVSAFFKEDSQQTAADKMSRVLELEADRKESIKFNTLNR